MHSSPAPPQPVDGLSKVDVLSLWSESGKGRESALQGDTRFGLIKMVRPNQASTCSKRHDDSGRGAARVEDAQRTPTQSHISTSIPVNEDYIVSEVFQRSYGLLEMRTPEDDLLGSRYKFVNFLL